MIIFFLITKISVTRLALQGNSYFNQFLITMANLMHFSHLCSFIDSGNGFIYTQIGCVKTPNIKILNSLCVHLWMRNEFFIFL